MKKVCVLCVCGSGTVTSSMLAAKLKEKLAEKGYDADCIETNPGGVESTMSSHPVDFMACSSPVPGDYGVPKLAATSFLIGLDEEGFMEEVLEVLKDK
ncbi:MAG: PTS fructose transporter subunit IIB [Butyricicoccus sp.]|uniref:PTS fructose transporter subunit IIB n=1 Tax=Intestinibacillus sp. Marseille-P6563 TaxID=2364792 RepID=UPI000F051451|nr:PTS fructose transporter subunit IIB [Intestinibacillus sp. Marseille-P6563]MDR3765920.1 PTS fructose transporter subunit IIB [Butyricicoccus sp.]